MGISSIGIEKQSAERKRLELLLAKQEKSIRDAFRSFLNSMDSDETVKQVNDALENGNIDAALGIVDSAIVRMSSVIPAVFVSVGIASMPDIAESIKQPSIGLRFDPGNPRAAEIMQQNRLRFVAEFTEKQREATRQALTRGLQVGTGPRQVAATFRASIGLTATQEAAVANYRALLEMGSRQALDRGLRDRRFDGTVTRAIDSDRTLTGEQIDRMVTRYRERYLQYRAETIARTEAVKATSLARQESMRQLVEDSGVDPERIVRVWNTTQDKRTRDAHAVMDGQEVGPDEPFIDGDGNELMFPGDPNAPIETIANCRCTFSVRIK